MIQSLILFIYPVAGGFSTFVQIGLITPDVPARLIATATGRHYWTDKHPMPWSLPVGMCFTLSGLVLLAMAGSFGGVLLRCGAGGYRLPSVFHPNRPAWCAIFSGGRVMVRRSLSSVSGGNFGSSLGPLLAAVIIARPRQRECRSVCAGRAAGEIVVLAQISRWHAAQHRIAKGKPCDIANPLPRTKSLAVSVLLLPFSRNISIWRASVLLHLLSDAKIRLSIQNAQLHLFAFRLRWLPGR